MDEIFTEVIKFLGVVIISLYVARKLWRVGSKCSSWAEI